MVSPDTSNLKRFNPRPAFPPGATRCDWQTAYRLPGFNPRPAFPPGATWKPDYARPNANLVSILARRFHQAQLCDFRGQPHVKRFQSSPGVSTGAQHVESHAFAQLAKVSILARRFHRAQRYFAISNIRGAAMFQSSPGVSTGRNLVSSTVCPNVTRFNPRPAFPPGATCHYADSSAVSINKSVSILARRFHRAQLFASFDKIQQFLVSILARRFHRAQPVARPPGSRDSRRGFNPRPAFPPGATQCACNIRR